ERAARDPGRPAKGRAEDRPGDTGDTPDLLRPRLRLRPPGGGGPLFRRLFEHGSHAARLQGMHQRPAANKQARLRHKRPRTRRHSPLRAPAGRHTPLRKPTSRRRTSDKARDRPPRRRTKAAQRRALHQRQTLRRALRKERPLQARLPEDLLVRPRDRPQKPLLHDGRQPYRLLRLPLLRPRPGGRHHRRSPRPLLAPGAGRRARV
ncbi:MAG: Signal peptidase I, partial [uncultured Rubrobacteraceae bacterium]